ncbi:MAG: protein kinase [Iphinoe sp. HA4291-MV1]|jgi:serine/threonine protein kinase|nr:protein kinase [Iphinoe sp. HA4291-MV1]
MVWISGQKLQGGRYTLEKKLGQGGFGVTYLAKDKNGNQVVIKTLKDVDTDTYDFDQYQQNFVNEALKLKGCQHPHIVKVYELIKEGELWGMVMEYIEGENIRSQPLPLPESEALLYIHQIGDALKVVHNNSLLHRDVNPNNIMVRAGKSEAVLIDFGIAREFTPNLTQTHTVIRTPFYAPPEQENPRAKRGAYTDVYSLAATLYKLLTGKEPESAISRMFGESLKSPKELNSNISDRVNQAILQAMELRPENRPQSMQEWLALLDTEFASTPPVNSSFSISTVGVDYSNLNKLLATDRWKEADEETKAIMLRVSGRETEGV